MDNGQRLAALEAHPQFETAIKIIERLRRGGHFTVLAGGCVRDALLGLRPKDLDLATSAKPGEIEAAFAKTLAVGKAFGTIVVVEDGHNFEVTTFRQDGPYVDGRHPASVSFSSIEEDARRRDFTVNALFYDPRGPKVLDFVGGVKDLSRGLLRTVGPADQRFSEDRLRMLRAVRFVSQLGFELDPGALEAIRSSADQLAKVSVERIFAETRRLLESNYLVKGLKALLDSGQEKIFWPELTHFDVDRVLVFSKFVNWENAFAALCYLTHSDPNTRLQSWRAPRESTRKIKAQLEALRIFAAANSSRAARARALGGEDYAEVVVLMQGLFDARKMDRWITEYLEIADEEGRLPKPFLNGEDLRGSGVLPGREMGEHLREIYDGQLEGRLRSRPEAMLELKRRLAKS